jgi:hypothetical protein
MVSLIDSAVLTLTELSCLVMKKGWNMLPSKLLVLVGPIATRTAAPEVDDPRYQADRGRTVGQVNSPLLYCGTIRARYQIQRAGR